MEELEEVFRALADPTRRRLLDNLNEQEGQTLAGLGRGLDMTRQSVSKHLAVLERAGLVVTLRRGREKWHYLNPAPIGEIADRWISRYHRHRVEALSDLKRALEAPTVDSSAFVYTTVIRTTPAELWQALIDPAFTRRYWDGVEILSDWKKGSTYRMRNEERGFEVEDPDQVVLESDPYRRLSYTWHTFTPEWARGYDIAEELRAKWSREARSKVSFEIEDLGPLVKLTVVHDGFEPGSEVREGVGEGWPFILSALKTLLETGESLPQPEPPAQA